MMRFLRVVFLMVRGESRTEEDIDAPGVKVRIGPFCLGGFCFASFSRAASRFSPRFSMRSLDAAACSCWLFCRNFVVANFALAPLAALPPKSARSVAPPLPTKSSDFAGFPIFGRLCPEVPAAPGSCSEPASKAEPPGPAAPPPGSVCVWASGRGLFGFRFILHILRSGG